MDTRESAISSRVVVVGGIYLYPLMRAEDLPIADSTVLADRYLLSLGGKGTHQTIARWRTWTAITPPSAH